MAKAWVLHFASVGFLVVERFSRRPDAELPAFVVLACAHVAPDGEVWVCGVDPVSVRRPSPEERVDLDHAGRCMDVLHVSGTADDPWHAQEALLLCDCVTVARRVELVLPVDRDSVGPLFRAVRNNLAGYAVSVSPRAGDGWLEMTAVWSGP